MVLQNFSKSEVPTVAIFSVAPSLFPPSQQNRCVLPLGGMGAERTALFSGSCCVFWGGHLSRNIVCCVTHSSPLQTGHRWARGGVHQASVPGGSGLVCMERVRWEAVRGALEVAEGRCSSSIVE